MSTLLTTTSTTRASLSPSAGDMFFETDTTRLIVFDGTGYVVFNKDSMSFVTGGAEDLHYAAGSFSDATAEYYVSDSPVLHFDSSRADGSFNTPSNVTNMGPQFHNGSEVNPNGRAWRNRLNVNQYFADASRNLAYDQLEKAYFINGRSTSTVGVSEDLGGDFTYFLVQKDPTKIIGLTYSYSTGKEMFLYDGSNMYVAGYAVGDASTVASDGISGELDLFVVRRAGGNAKLWTLSKATGIPAGTDRIGATVDIGNQPVKTLNVRSLARTQSTKLDGYLYEMIVFPTALSQANMDIVHKYILNKYTDRLSHTRKDGSSQIVTDVTDTAQYSLTSI